MGAIKGKNGRDLVDAKEIKKRWKEYTKRLYNIQMVWLVTKRPDILEYEVKWALRSTAVNKASGCNEIPEEIFISLKEDAIKALHSLCKQIWETQQWPQHWKRSFIPIPKKGSTKECASHWMIALISPASKIMLQILHARLQDYMNQELPDVQAGFRKGRDQIANIC